MTLNPNQFQLFYSAKELQDHLNYSGDQAIIPGEGKEAIGEMWDRKLRESQVPLAPGQSPGGKDVPHGAGLFDAMSKTGGYREGMDATGGPLQVVHSPRNGELSNYVHQGHHRIATAAALATEKNPQWINTEHVDPRPGRMQGINKDANGVRRLTGMAGALGQRRAIGTPELHDEIANLVKLITG